MKDTIYSPIKINLSLRILSAMPDRYHKVYSLFWQKDAAERLTITQKCGEIISDVTNVSGVKISGENLVDRSIAAVRAAGYDIPPINVSLHKFFPTGSGIGAGSGNAAAILKWLKTNYGAALTDKEIGSLGADVAFLASDYVLAHATGRGEVLSDAGIPPSLGWLLVFPNWSSSTKDAYRSLDKMRSLSRQNVVVSQEQAKAEACELVDTLRAGKRSGRIENDFFPLLVSAHREYLRAESIADDVGALAWGLCGSGSAFFMLFDDSDAAKTASGIFAEETWVNKTYFLE
ncbi:MAG: hypothetical protein Q4E17_05810 [Synergistes sp.]|nr:hypothetical protein [Synergistes sp.]